MAKRKSFSKKERFEVFKRDSFTCQYCGSSAPNTILELDHIDPISKGGSNNIMNLITSCFECNRGKSDRKLDDDSIVEKQKNQIKELNLRRQQLEMMLEWRDGLNDIKNETSQKAINYFNDKFESFILSKSSEQNISKLVSKYGIISVLDNIDTVVSKYHYIEDEDERLKTCYAKLGAFLNLSTKPEHRQKIAYIKGIARNKFNYFNEKTASILLNKYYEDGYCLDDLKSKLINNEFRHWTMFKGYLEPDYNE